MGLQTWTPSSSRLSSMACLDVETPSICMVLQLRLQQRRTREQLVEQGIMPPLKTPVAFHEQIRNLERARTGNFLKHKLCSRPQRSELVHMHILEETQAEPSLQATQMKLKRARLTDDLNEKIAQRPGPMELVEKNILPVDEVVHGDRVINSKPADISSFEEDSGEALSPEQPCRHQSPSSTSASPSESGGTEAVVTSSTSNTPVQQTPPPNSQSSSDSISLSFTKEQLSNQQASQSNTYVAPKITPVLVKQSLPKLSGDKSRSKRSKEPKPRVKKLKYHQYIPPDQKLDLNEVQMDSAYARLLQQQQQFLQLQILSQQQYNYQAAVPSTIKPTTEVQTSCSSGAISENVASNPVHPRHSQTNRKLDHLPAKLDEMKVSELKMELKLRSLPVSGTKTDLIERLKLYLENSNSLTSTGMTAVTAALQSESKKLTPPVSPIASKVSTLGLDDSIVADSAAKHSNTVFLPVNATQRVEDCSTETRSTKKNSEKDKRLHEKERQIKELIRKLEQEQKLVEELKMQLEVEKMSQQGNSPPRFGTVGAVQVKEENGPPSNGSAPCGSPGAPATVKQETAEDQSRLLPDNNFIKSLQTVKLSETLQPVQGGAQILHQAPPPASTVTIPLPASGSAASRAGARLVQTPGQVPQTIEPSAALQCSSQPLTKMWRMESMAQTSLSTIPAGEGHVGASSGQAVPNESLRTTLQAFSQHPKFPNRMPKCKDPPRYEDAIKQTRSMPVAVQTPTAASQQMDDLFDVLIESGEISPFIRQNPPSQDKPLPVTASVTTLPINTVLSRPPPLVQVAQLPPTQIKPPASLQALTPDTRMKALLDGILNTHTEPQTLKLMDELHSPMVTMEVEAIENTPPSSLNLHPANIDNMDWLDLNLSAQAGGVNSLDMSTPVGVFSSDFLDAGVLHLNWD